MGTVCIGKGANGEKFSVVLVKENEGFLLKSNFCLSDIRDGAREILFEYCLCHHFFPQGNPELCSSNECWSE